MKHIPQPDLSHAEILTPAEMNKIHFGGKHTPLTPDQLRALAQADNESDSATKEQK